MPPAASQMRARAPARPDRQTERRPPLRAVQPRPRRRRPERRRRAIVTLSVFVVVVSLLAVAGAHAYLTQGQVRLTRLQEQLNAQLQQRHELELRVAGLEQPANVLSDAQKQGLVVPTTVNDLPQVDPSTTHAQAPGHPATTPTQGASGTQGTQGTSGGQSTPGTPGSPAGQGTPFVQRAPSVHSAPSAPAASGSR